MDAFDNTLIIFLKYPQPGLVKTRLGADIGNEKAAYIYKKFTEFILEEIKSNIYYQVIFYSPENKREEIVSWLGKDFEFYPQQGDDLGERIQHAFDYTFSRGAKRVVIIGTDNPLVSKDILQKAFSELVNSQAVIGPCLDGGYYLLGLSNYSKDIFEGITWSSKKVLEQTISKLKKQGFQYKTLEKQFDVDDIQNLKLLKDKLEKEQLDRFKTLREVLARVSK